MQRDDDKEATVRKRLEVYHTQTKPLIDYYRNWSESGDLNAPSYIRVEGVGPMEQVRDHIFEALEAK